jgi:D-cysteine desulfhydrase
MEIENKEPELKLPEKMHFAVKPTPIERMSYLSDLLKKDIYVKRDDLTGFELSGNKVRKLEYLIKKAIDEQADVVITCGGIQSNHARATSFLAVKHGLKPVLVLKGENQEDFQSDFQGNYLLNRIIGAEVRPIDMDQWDDRDEIMGLVAEEYENQGKKAFIIPEGGSNSLGALGYLDCVSEISDQCECDFELPDKFDSVFCATGSGGTYSGMLLGKYIRDLMETDFYTVNVCDDENYFTEKVKSILTDTIRDFELPIGFLPEDIRIIDGFVGPGYAKADEALFKFIMEVTRHESLIFDPVYTGKALYGMVESLKNVPEAFGKKILFVHTGGGFANFTFSKEFERVINS